MRGCVSHLATQLPRDHFLERFRFGDLWRRKQRRLLVNLLSFVRLCRSCSFLLSIFFVAFVRVFISVDNFALQLKHFRTLTKAGWEYRYLL